MKNSTTPARQLDLQGLAGYVSVSFLLFFGHGFWKGLGMKFNDFCMDLDSVLDAKIDKNVIDFGDHFWKA